MQLHPLSSAFIFVGLLTSSAHAQSTYAEQGIVCLPSESDSPPLITQLPSGCGQDPKPAYLCQYSGVSCYRLDQNVLIEGPEGSSKPIQVKFNDLITDTYRAQLAQQGDSQGTTLTKEKLDAIKFEDVDGEFLARFTAGAIESEALLPPEPHDVFCLVKDPILKVKKEDGSTETTPRLACPPSHLCQLDDLVDTNEAGVDFGGNVKLFSAKEEPAQGSTIPATKPSSGSANQQRGN